MNARPAVFVDRDGTLIEELGHLGDPGLATLIPGAARGLGALRSAGFALVVVSNQAGVARGLITEDDVRAVNDRTAELLAAEGVRIDGWYFCPHHPDFTGPCQCRKPGSKMFLDAARDLGIDLEASWMVGDHRSDLEAARRLSMPAVLVLTGHGADSLARLPEDASRLVVADLGEAALVILGAAARQ